MKSKLSLLAAIVVAGLGALTTGCYAETGYVVTNDAYTYDYVEPTLVSAGPNVWIVRGQPSVYYADDTYWTYSGDVWYRSSYPNRGWVAVNAAPVYVVNHYHSGRTVQHRVTAQPRVVHRAAQPHVAHRPARPHVRVLQTNDARVRVPTSKPAPSVRASGSARVKVTPSSGAHKASRPSIRVGGSAHTSIRAHHR